MRHISTDACPSGTSSQLCKEDLESFRKLSALAHQDAGLVLTEDKAPMVVARLGKRMRTLGFGSLEEYHAYVLQPGHEAERSELIYTLTTNITSFMREAHHFDAVRDQFVPSILDKLRSGLPIRLWSAGCSTGQEPYSLAITLAEAIPKLSQYDIKILATDIDQHVLKTAKQASYPKASLGNLSRRIVEKYFTKQIGADAEAYSVVNEIRSLVRFNQLNLLNEWPMRKKFDLIFCRNVVIYFDRCTQRNLWGSFSNHLTQGGYLFIGHSERLNTEEFPSFRASGTTTYIKN